MIDVSKTYDQFYGQFNNQSVEVTDPNNLDQCFDLAVAWCIALGLPITIFSGLSQAYQIWNPSTALAKQNFTYIPNVVNDPTVKPIKGDLVVFGQKVGVSGHVSVDTGNSDGKNVVSFDQNWDTAHYYHIDPKTGLHIPYSRVVVHENYFGVLGWLRFKGTALSDHDLVVKTTEILKSHDTNDNTVFRINKLYFG